MFFPRSFFGLFHAPFNFSHLPISTAVPVLVSGLDSVVYRFHTFPQQTQERWDNDKCPVPLIPEEMEPVEDSLCPVHTHPLQDCDLDKLLYSYHVNNREKRVIERPFPYFIRLRPPGIWLAKMPDVASAKTAMPTLK